MLPLLLIVAGIILLARQTSRAVARNRYLGISCLSLPVVIVVCIMAGMIAASLESGGHYYSVPIGGDDPAVNTAILASAIFWIARVLFVFSVLSCSKN